MGNNYMQELKIKNMGDDSSVEVEQGVSLSKVVQVTQNTDSALYRFPNSECFICTGKEGSSFGEYLCRKCHDYLYTGLSSEATIVVPLWEDSDESESEYTVLEEQKSLHKVTGDITVLPTEILMKIMKYCDDTSLWSMSQVCAHWKSVILQVTDEKYWKDSVISRWPWFSTKSEPESWYSMYSKFVRSNPCFNCFVDMAKHCRFLNEWTDTEKHSFTLHLNINDVSDKQVELFALDREMCHWQVGLIGPKASPYENGLFFVYIQVPPLFSECSLNIRFLTKIFHPCISRHGDIYLPKDKDWAVDLDETLLKIENILANPDLGVFVEPYVGLLYQRHRTTFEYQAKLWTTHYAQHHLKNSTEI